MTVARWRTSRNANLAPNGREAALTDVDNDIEIWKPVAGFPSYAASSLGRIKRIAPDAYGRTLASVLRAVARPDGYVAYSLHEKGVQKVMLGHRIICEAFNGPAPEGKPYACHFDGNKSNNAVANLRWDSASANNFDKVVHGTMLKGDAHPAVYDGSYLPRGSSHKMAKLDESKVVAIRLDNRSTSAIASDYGVSQSLISMIKTRKIWKHI